MKRTWKMGLPMYLLSDELKQDYLCLQTHVIEHLAQSGFQDEIELITEFPNTLTNWWLDPSVLLTQTCGYPLMHTLHNQVQLLATPCFDILGCQGPTYSSALVCRRNQTWSHVLDAYGSRAVINQIDSNSGMNVFRAAIAEYEIPQFFKTVDYSGSHIASLDMIQKQHADIAAIDCVSLHYARQHDPQRFCDIRILTYSQSTYALPYICAKNVPTVIQQLIISALMHLHIQQPALMQRLRIQSFVPSNLEDYASILALEHDAQSRGYPFLQ